MAESENYCTQAEPTSRRNLTTLLSTASSRLEDFMDNRTARKIQELRGHSGSVYAVSFDPAQLLLLSSSEDKTSTWRLAVHAPPQMRIVELNASDGSHCSWLLAHSSLIMQSAFGP